MSTDAAFAVLSATNASCRGTTAEEIGAPDREAQVAAAKAAGAHAFISELPEGYHTPIGNGGVILSPSQRLRLTIARLLAADPPSVVIDDPTAGLDAAAETVVLPGLEALLRGRNVVVVRASPAVSAAVARAASRDSGCGRPVAHTTAPTVPRLPPDPALPSLPQLLDGGAMAGLLGRTVDEGGIPDVRVHSVRYKPGDNVVVQYSVAASGGWSTAVAYATAETGLEAKRDRGRNRKLVERVRGRTPAPEALGYLPEVSALVQWLPLDVRLPLLSETGEKLTGRLAKRGLTDMPGEEPELLRYWPRRRAVLRFGPHILKVYRDASDFQHARRGLRASAALRRVHTPAFEGSIRAKRTTVQSLLPGQTPSLWPRASEAAGGVLADLHADTLLPLSTTSVDDTLTKAAVRADFIADLLPEIRQELDALLAELTARVPSDLPLVTSHGNFHAGQLLDGRDGLSLIDLDRLCLAAPAYDLTSFAAHVAFGRPGEMDLVAATLDSLLVGYRRRPGGLEWFLANCLLRRAHVPFRFQDEHWPDAVANLITSAREALR